MARLMMRKNMLILLLWGTLMSLFALPTAAQEHRYWVHKQDGKPIGELQFQPVEIVGDRPSKSTLRKGKKRLKRYTRLKWHVHKVYPYAKKVGEILDEIEQEMASLPDSVRMRHYIKSKEENLFGRYEQDIRKMTRTQGKILVKLVHRETGQSMYYLVKDVKSGATALFWQSIGLIFGINLKTEYDEYEKDNKLIESFVQELESGGYNIVYKTRNYYLR
jgi:hypothetical protein